MNGQFFQAGWINLHKNVNNFDTFHRHTVSSEYGHSPSVILLCLMHDNFTDLEEILVHGSMG